MKILIALFIILISCTTFTRSAYGQSSKKVDTIFYYIDNKTPVNDCMITTVSEYSKKAFYINCRYLKDNQVPAFYCDTLKRIAVEDRDIKKIKFISLPELIEKVRQLSFNEFRERYIVYFVENVNQAFVKSKALLMLDRNDIFKN